jgi:hypothetical protein
MMSYMQLFIGSMTTYSLAYSTAIGWTTPLLGMTDLGGPSSLMFAKDGVTSC